VQLADAGGLPVLLAALHAQQGTLASAAMSAVAHLTENTPASHVQAGATGAIEAVLAAMVAHHAHAQLQVDACRALAVLFTVEGHEACAAAATGAVLAAMQAHQRNAMVLAHACHTLALLHSTRVAAHDFNAQAGAAVSAVVAAMRAHGADSSVQECGCRFVAAFTDAADGGPRAMAAGAFDAVGVAMREHATHLGVQIQAYSALVCAANTDGAQARAYAAGALPPVLAFLRAHRGGLPFDCGYADADALLTASAALSTLVMKVPEAAAHAGRLGAVETVVAFVRAQRSAPMLLVSAFHALDVLMTVNDNTRAAHRAGAVHEVSLAMHTHADAAALHETGRKILERIALMQQDAVATADAAMAALLAEEEEEAAAARDAKPSARKQRSKKRGAQAPASAAGASGTGDAPAAAHGAPEPAGAGAEADGAALDDAVTAAVPPVAVVARSAEAERRRRRAATKAARRAGGGAGQSSSAASANAAAELGASVDAEALPDDGDAPAAPAAPPDPAADALLPPCLRGLSLHAPLPPAQMPPLPPPVLPPLPMFAAVLQPPLPATAPSAPPPPPPPPVMKECCVCFLDVLSGDLLALTPCGHRCVCEACSDVLLARPPASRLCPVCTKAVGGAIRIYDL
jgi:hypothetical protein